MLKGFFKKSFQQMVNIFLIFVECVLILPAKILILCESPAFLIFEHVFSFSKQNDTESGRKLTKIWVLDPIHGIYVKASVSSNAMVFECIFFLEDP